MTNFFCASSVQPSIFCVAGKLLSCTTSPSDPHIYCQCTSFQHCAKIHNINLLQVCYTSSSEVRPPHYLRPALASLCLVLEHLCQGRLLPLQDLGLCRRSQAIGKNGEAWKLKRGEIHGCGGLSKQKPPGFLLLKVRFGKVRLYTCT